jgi:UDP-galactopyranose mutase
MKTALIIGGGPAGCAAAHVLSLQGGWDVTVVEKASSLGAGVRTQWYGGHPYTFGPRHFLTQNEEVFEFFNKYCPLRRCQDHRFLSYVENDGNFYNYPIHMDDIPNMPESDKIFSELKEAKQIQGAAQAKNLEEYWISSVGQTLYEKFIDGYSKKMWQVEDNRLIDDFAWSPKGVALKEGSKEAWDTAISAYPHAADGYDQYFDLSTKDATVLLNTEIEHFDLPNKTVVLNGRKQSYDVIVNTASPDDVMNGVHGKLPYIGREFHKFVLPVQFAFPENVYFLYYTGNERLTRLVEYKKFTRQKYNDPSTIIGMEIPVIDGGKHYPLPFKSEIAKAQKYFDDMPDNVFSFGRAGTYQYGYDIDDCIESALEMGKKLKS